MLFAQLYHAKLSSYPLVQRTVANASLEECRAVSYAAHFWLRDDKFF